MQQLTLFDLLNESQSQDSFAQNLLNPPKSFELRDYQKALKNLIYRDIRQGKKRILVYAPTGAGKTAILSSVLSDALSKNKRSMLIIHRDFLVEQSRVAMIKSGINRTYAMTLYVAHRKSGDSLGDLAQRIARHPD